MYLRVCVCTWGHLCGWVCWRFKLNQNYCRFPRSTKHQDVFNPSSREWSNALTLNRSVFFNPISLFNGVNHYTVHFLCVCVKLCLSKTKHQMANPHNTHICGLAVRCSDRTHSKALTNWERGTLFSFSSADFGWQSPPLCPRSFSALFDSQERD